MDITTPQKAPFTLLPNDGSGVFYGQQFFTNTQLANELLEAKKSKERLAAVGFSSKSIDNNIEKLAEAVRARRVAPAISEAERNRLVETPISPTISNDVTEAEKQAQHEKRKRQREADDALVKTNELTSKEADELWKERLKKDKYAKKRFEGVDFDTGELLRAAPKSEGGSGKFTVISHREWSGEYRIRTQVEMASGLPPLQEGVRSSDFLSERGARNIADSCHFMHIKHGGYKTFMTLTLDDAARCRVEERFAEGPCCKLDLSPIKRVARKELMQFGPVRPFRRGRLEPQKEYKPKTTHWVDSVPTYPKTFVDSEGQPITDSVGRVVKIDGPVCEVVAIGGRVYAAANAQAGDDMTYQTVQKELSRFLDGMQKMKKRGWKATKVYKWKLDGEDKTTQVKCYGKVKSKVLCRRKMPWGKWVSCIGDVAAEIGEEASGVTGIKYPRQQLEKKYPWGRVKCHHDMTLGEPRKGFLAEPKIHCVRDGVKYCWVVENPLSEKTLGNGKVVKSRNPHIHLLCDWRVEPECFDNWAARLEALWGQGFNHIEKIKDTSAAGAYLAKACGYLSKATDEDQGPVRGNRYGISEASRAPDWACIGRYELSIMGHLIKDVSEYFQHSYAVELSQRKQLKQRLEENKLPPKTDPDHHKIKANRKKICDQLTRVRKKINDLPAIPSKYQLVLKTKEALKEFIGWARGRPSAAPWLPEKHKDDVWQHNQRPDGLWLSEFQFRLYARKAARRWAGVPLGAYERWMCEELEQETPTIGHWLEYESMAA